MFRVRQSASASRSDRFGLPAGSGRAVDRAQAAGPTAPLTRITRWIIEQFHWFDAVKRRHLGIAAWAVALAALAGTTELPLPAEDAFRALRAEIRSRPVPQDIVVVAIDDKTLNELGQTETDRRQDAKVVDALFAAGAKRVFFDRAYADATTPEADAAFAAALQRHWPNVYLGGNPRVKEFAKQHDEFGPLELFQRSSKIVSMVGQSAPFGLGVRFPSTSHIAGETRPSLSAELAGLKRIDYWYRVDLAWSIGSVPTASFVDVLKSRLPQNQFKDVDVIVAPTHIESSDKKPLPFGGYTAGVFYHVIGAHTLKAGPPREWGWLPALALAAVIVCWVSTSRPRSRKLLLGSASLLLAAPFLLDETSNSVDVMPALICLGIFALRIHWLRARLVDERSGLLRVEELRTLGPQGGCDVVAFKFCNLAEIAAQASDQRIEQVVTALTRRIRSTEADAQFAFSKDTIVWLRPRLDTAELREHLRGMQAVTQTGLEIDGRMVEVRAAIGADVNRKLPFRERVENAIQCAEDAARRGEACLIADAAHLAERALRLELLDDLDSALQNRQVELAYQPKVCLATGRIVGAEALLRWHHPDKGYINPERLVAMAEAHGRIDELTMYALRHALCEAQVLRQFDPLFTIAVNVSPIALRSLRFLYDLNRLFERFAFAPQFLTVEITEHCPIDHEVVADVLRALRKQNVNISIDDFGTGQATFSYLKEIPGGEVKIDRSFITNLATSPSDQAIVRAAIEMAENLGRIVVAEGVETAEVAQMLKEMGCHHAQGYLYSPAVPSWKISSMLQEQQAA